MALFLNKMFFGQRAYGVAAAAQVYFNKSLEDISIAEAATLPACCRHRHDITRSAASPTPKCGAAMFSVACPTSAISIKQQYDDAMALPIESRMHGAAIEFNAPYVAEMVRREMLSRYGEATLHGRLSGRYDTRRAHAARSELFSAQRLLEFTRRRGYRGPLSQLSQFGLAGILETPFDEWPVEIRADTGAIRAGRFDGCIGHRNDEVSNSRDNHHKQWHQTDSFPWSGLSWAKPFIDRSTFGPRPESVTDVLAVGDVILVMPTATGILGSGAGA